MAVTLAPRSSSWSVRSPWPQPSSSTRRPATGPIASSSICSMWSGAVGGIEAGSSAAAKRS